MAKQNLTIQLDEDEVRDAKVLAAMLGTSVRGLVVRSIRDKLAAAGRYEEAKRHAMAALPNHAAKTSSPASSERTWTREDIYDRWS